MRQDKWLRWSLGVFLLAAFAWYLLARTTFLVAYTLNGGPATLGQIHAWCSANDPVIFGPTSVSVCTTSVKWWDLSGFLEFVMVVTVLVLGFRVYRNVFHPARAQRGY